MIHCLRFHLLPFLVLFSFAATPARGDGLNTDTLVWNIAVSEGEPTSPFLSLAQKFRERVPSAQVASRSVTIVSNLNEGVNYDAAESALSPAPPDLLTFTTSRRAKEVIAMGQFRNMTDLWVRNGLLDPATGVPSALAKESRDANGDYVTLPFQSSLVTMLYRKSMLAKAGVAVPQTWEELLVALQKCSAYAGADRDWAAALTAGLEIDTTSLWWLDMVTARRYGPAFQSDLLTGKISLTDDPRVKSALAHITDMALSSTHLDMGDFFKNAYTFLGGATPFYFGVSFTAHLAPAELVPDIGVMVFPSMAQGVPRGEVAPYRAYTIPKRAARPDLAEAFIEKVLLDPEIYTDTQIIPGLGALSAPTLPRHRHSVANAPLITAIIDVLEGAGEIMTPLQDALPAFSEALRASIIAAVTFTPKEAKETSSRARDTQEQESSSRLVGTPFGELTPSVSMAQTQQQQPTAAQIAQARAFAEASIASALEKAEAVRIATFLGKTPNPVATPAAGHYPAPLSITLTGALDTAAATTTSSGQGDKERTKIHYTIDGSAPSDLSPVYSTPIEVTSPGDIVIRYYAVSPGLEASERVSIAYRVTGGNSLGTQEYILYFGLPGLFLFLILALVVYYVRRRVKSSEETWRIDPKDVTLHKDKVLGVGSFGIVYEGDFRGTAVAIKEIFLDRSHYDAALAAATSLNNNGKAGTFSVLSASKLSRASSGGPETPDLTLPGSTTIKQAQRHATDASDNSERPLINPSSTGPGPARRQGLSGTAVSGSSMYGSRMMQGTNRHPARGGGGGVEGQHARAARRAALASEIAIISKMRHPNALFLFGCHLTRHKATLVMERMSSSVYEMIHSRTLKLSAKKRVEMALDAASGVTYLHAHTPNPVLHRDLKTPNLLVSDRGVVKVADFGLSEAGVPKGTSIGSAPWTAPEVFLNGKSYTAASDVYSFGIVLWEIATSLDPWADAESISDIMTKVCAGERLPLDRSVLAPNIPPGLADLIRQCWSHDPLDRPTMAEVRSKLEGLVAECPDEETMGTDLSLLHTMLPREAASGVISAARRGEPHPPHRIDSAVIGFADIVGFTTISSQLDPSRVSALLSECFKAFGQVLDTHGLVLVDTIGDAIFFAGGLSHADQQAIAAEEEEKGRNGGVSPRGGHLVGKRMSIAPAGAGSTAGERKSVPRLAEIARGMCEASLEMLELSTGVEIDPTRPEMGHVRWRFGIASGAVSAAVIGREQLQVQVVGNAVNVASRMESSGEPMRLQCTEDIRSLAGHAHTLRFKKRGAVEIKGKGTMNTYWVDRSPDSVVRVVSGASPPTLE